MDLAMECVESFKAKQQDSTSIKMLIGEKSVCSCATCNAFHLREITANNVKHALKIHSDCHTLQEIKQDRESS